MLADSGWGLAGGENGRQVRNRGNQVGRSLRDRLAASGVRVFVRERTRRSRAPTRGRSPQGVGGWRLADSGWECEEAAWDARRPLPCSVWAGGVDDLDVVVVLDEG